MIIKNSGVDLCLKKKYSLALVTIFFFISSTSWARSLTIKNAHVIDIMTGSILKNYSLLIQDGKIERISRKTLILPNSQIVDAKGAFVLPGLIDAHVHLGKEILAKGIAKIPGKNPYLKYHSIVDRARQSAQILAQSNAKIIFGSDTPASPTYGNLPGLNGFDELNELEKVGFSPLKILQAATIENAKVFGLEKTTGQIKVGKRADLLLLRKNPLQSIKNINSIEQVIVGGKLISRARLSANRSAQ